jgi:hypothetical protein
MGRAAWLSAARARRAYTVRCQNHYDLVRGVNPLKLYEYASAGLPVVSVAWPELQRLNAPIALAGGADDFVRAIDRSLTSPAAAETLRAFAAQHDWGVALDRLLAALELSPTDEVRDVDLAAGLA